MGTFSGLVEPAAMLGLRFRSVSIGRSYNDVRVHDDSGKGMLAQRATSEFDLEKSCPPPDRRHAKEASDFCAAGETALAAEDHGSKAHRRRSMPVFAKKLLRLESSSCSSSADEHSPTFLSQSSGNISTKSAPPTPAPAGQAAQASGSVGERLQQGQSQSHQQLSPGPTHRRTVKARAPAVPVAAPAPLGPSTGPTPSKARHKKFHRHFDSVAPDERVLNYYSCALVADILLQGHLYITTNYFAFYSNVFGYVTKLLIPTATVLKVSKEKTARIIPNAIGVATTDDKHVFGSLLSRDNTYKLMLQVWKAAVDNQPLALEPCALRLPKELEDSASGDVLLAEDDDSSLSGSGVDSPPPLDKAPVVAATAAARNGSLSALASARSGSLGTLGGTLGSLSTSGASTPAQGASARTSDGQNRPMHRPTGPQLVLAASTALLVLLFASAAVMLYRISRIQGQFRLQSGDDVYQDLARWQSQLHMRSASQVEEFLDTHLDQLAKVRQSLEALSLLIVEKDDPAPLQSRVPALHEHSHESESKNQHPAQQYEGNQQHLHQKWPPSTQADENS